MSRRPRYRRCSALEFGCQIPAIDVLGFNWRGATTTYGAQGQLVYQPADVLPPACNSQCLDFAAIYVMKTSGFAHYISTNPGLTSGEKLRYVEKTVQESLDSICSSLTDSSMIY
jgi:hypothetical protein